MVKPARKSAGGVDATTATAPPAPKTGRGPRPGGQRPLAHEVRIIGGLWKRTPLRVPTGATDLRPTPARVRETLFDWLGAAVVGARCIDAFAGTGALGFEAASRGALEVVLVEQEPKLVAALEATKLRLAAAAVRVVRGDGFSMLARQAPDAFDLVLLDPPFGSPLGRRALAEAARVVAPGGHVYLESAAPATRAARPEPEAVPPGLAVHRRLRAGAVLATLYRRLPDGTAD